MPFGLIANEVPTNALKHAFPDDRDRVDLAILDIKLKGSMTGIDVAHAARERAIPYLFISGSGEPTTRLAAEATGPLAFLQKPFNQEELVSILRTVAEREVAP